MHLLPSNILSEVPPSLEFTLTARAPPLWLPGYHKVTTGPFLMANTSDASSVFPCLSSLQHPILARHCSPFFFLPQPWVLLIVILFLKTPAWFLPWALFLPLPFLLSLCVSLPSCPGIHDQMPLFPSAEDGLLWASPSRLHHNMSRTKICSANLFCLVIELIMSQDPSMHRSFFFPHPSLKAAFVYSGGTTILLFPSTPTSTGLLGIAVLLFFETSSLALCASGLVSASLSWLGSYRRPYNAWIRVTAVLSHFPPSIMYKSPTS